jgi:hypothetical protein
MNAGARAPDTFWTKRMNRPESLLLFRAFITAEILKNWEQEQLSMSIDGMEIEQPIVNILRSPPF